VYYKLLIHYQKEKSRTAREIYSYIGICALLMFNFMAINALLSTFFNWDYNNLFSVQSDNKFVNRFLIVPIKILPIFLLVYVVYKINKEKINLYVKEFRQAATKPNNLEIIFWVYIIFSSLLLIFSIISPTLFKPI
jgi:hypothetical protein